MNKLWLKAALVRALKTVAQTAASLIGTQAVGILDVNWIAVASASALAGVLSILTSLAGLPEVPSGDGIQYTFNIDGIGTNMEVEDYEDQDINSEE